MLKIAQNPTTQPSQQVAFKGEEKEDKILEAIENNSKTANNCSKIALATSVATLLPLSVLAYKTGKLSKVAEELKGKAAPILDDVAGITGSIKGVTESVAKSLKESLELVNSKEWGEILQEVKTKIKGIDAEKVTEQLTKSLQELTDATTGKIKEINPENIDKLLADINTQINNINVKDLSNDARKILNSILEKVNSIKVSIG